MSSTETLIETTFPDVPWTGGSEIHRSIVIGFSFSGNGKGGMGSLTSAAVDKIPLQIWAGLQEHFHKFEWLLPYKEFRLLLLLDLYMVLNGGSPSTTRKMITNPHTGNKFHRIALSDNLVGAMRLLYDDVSTGIFAIRFRIVKMTEDGEEESVRREATELSATLSDTMESVLENYPEFIDISEPSAEEMEEAQNIRVEA
jgi:hypothetical protein